MSEATRGLRQIHCPKFTAKSSYTNSILSFSRFHLPHTHSSSTPLPFPVFICSSAVPVFCVCLASVVRVLSLSCTLSKPEGELIEHRKLIYNSSKHRSWRPSIMALVKSKMLPQRPPGALFKERFVGIVADLAKTFMTENWKVDYSSKTPDEWLVVFSILSNATELHLTDNQPGTMRSVLALRLSSLPYSTMNNLLPCKI